MVCAAKTLVEYSKPLCLHTFRHAAGTVSAELGEHQLTIRDYLRHSNLSVTNKYLQAASKTKRNTQARLVEAILPMYLLPGKGEESVAPRRTFRKANEEETSRASFMRWPLQGRDASCSRCRRAGSDRRFQASLLCVAPAGCVAASRAGVRLRGGVLKPCIYGTKLSR